MAIISQDIRDNQESEGRISNFLKQYGIGKLLLKCGAGKEKGICITAIFRYLLCLMFSDRSMYMQIATGRFAEGYSKNTVYRFLNSCKTNWERFTILLSESLFLTTAPTKRQAISIPNLLQRYSTMFR